MAQLAYGFRERPDVRSDYVEEVSDETLVETLSTAC